MIQRALSSQTEEIKQLWNLCFKQEDSRYTEYYFKYLFQAEHCYVVVEDGKVVSSLIRAPHNLVLHGQVLRTSMILGVCTHPSYRHRGYMKQLMDITLDACEHSELVTLIQAYNPRLYEPYGFETIYRRSAFKMQARDLPRTNVFGLNYNPKALDLLKVYSVFIRRFNGFYARDLAYFVKYRKEIIAQGGKIVAYYDGKDQIQGYASLLPDGKKQLRIEEVVYLDATCLVKLLNAAARENPNLVLEVSEAEDLSGAFPKAERVIYDSTMVRLNHPVLFSKLYGHKVETVAEAFALDNRPLNLNEFA
ncbi:MULTISPECIES: GNAT family N-acetyltransferase [Terrabacteria group]|uniref:GNAT family N-acetyltransferase n=1 Tax=Bacillati TaxID=1783272 RepID=UPI001C6EB4C2|nr:MULTISPECIES: GNAT family N-acetyltransferase [Terrabacteria group]MBW9212455.1 GNAT family N-acetyltransferase [Trueperella sp. zg.1013]